MMQSVVIVLLYIAMTRF